MEGGEEGPEAQPLMGGGSRQGNSHIGDGRAVQRGVGWC